METSWIKLETDAQNIFDSFKDIHLYGGHELDYSEPMVLDYFMSNILDPTNYNKGSIQEFENIFRNAKNITSAAAGSGRMDVVFNEMLFATGNTDFKYVGFDYAPQPERTRIQDWLETSHPEKMNAVSLQFEKDFFNIESFQMPNSEKPDFVIIHNALDLLWNMDNYPTLPVMDELCGYLESGTHVMLTIGGARNPKYAEYFTQRGFEEVICVGDMSEEAAVRVLRKI